MGLAVGPAMVGVADGVDTESAVGGGVDVGVAVGGTTVVVGTGVVTVGTGVSWGAGFRPAAYAAPEMSRVATNTKRKTSGRRKIMGYPHISKALPHSRKSHPV